jgi:hypothetical protein
MFANPAFLWAVAAGAMPVLVHLIFRRQRRAIDFPTLMFMRKVEMKLASRRRLREILLLTLRALVLICLALALARPGFRAQADGRVAVSADCVIILDNSASMGFKSPAGTRFDEARTQALAVLDTLGAEGRAAILTTVPCEASCASSTLSGDREKLLAALNGIQPADGAGSLPGVLARAAEILSQSSSAPNKEIYLFSDLQRNAWRDEQALKNAAGALSSRTALFICPVAAGAPEKNVSILSVTTDPRPKVSGRRMTLLARIKNQTAREITTGVKAELRDLPPQSAMLTLAPGAQQDVPLSLVLGAEGFATGQVSLEADDAPFDNVWPFYVDVRGPVRVLLIATPASRRDEIADSFYLRKALDPTGDGRLSGIRVTQVAPQEVVAGRLDNCDAVILCGGAGLPETAAHALQAFVEGGGGLMIFSGAGDAALAAGHPLQKLLPGRMLGEQKARAGQEPWGLRAVRMASPYFDDSRNADGRVEFKNVGILKLLKVEPHADAQVLAEAGGLPVLLEARRGGGRVLWWMIGANAEDSNLPLMPSFLSLLHCGVAVLSNAQWAPIERKAGQPVSLDFSGAAAPAVVTLYDPLSKSREVPVRSGRLNWPETDKAGIYRLVAKRNGLPTAQAKRSDPQGFAIAPDAEESDTERLKAEEASLLIPGPRVLIVSSQEGIVSAISSARQGRDLFGIFVLAALLLLLAETMLANMLGTSSRKPYLTKSASRAPLEPASRFNLPAAAPRGEMTGEAAAEKSGATP